MRTLLGDFAGGPVVTTLRLQYRASISGRGTRSHVSCGGTKKQVNKHDRDLTWPKQKKEKYIRTEGSKQERMEVQLNQETQDKKSDEQRHWI